MDRQCKNSDSLTPDRFNRLLMAYVRQVGQYYQNNPEVQKAVKSLQKSLDKD
ncbi:hypothetical protein [Spirosoma sp.]|uniref:hypothetical protein n=1 Tax=Spirosoma sp. TaxID=1899569 RepID=UPI003B3A3031